MPMIIICFSVETNYFKRSNIHNLKYITLIMWWLVRSFNQDLHEHETCMVINLFEFMFCKLFVIILADIQHTLLMHYPFLCEKCGSG